MGVVLESPTVMFEDNTGCISLANNTMTTGKTKHIDVRYHFIRDMVKSGAIQITWCRTEDMIADALTKPLTQNAFCRHCKYLCGA